MAIDALVKPFLRLALFQGLKPYHLTEIVRRAERIVYKPGDMIIEEDKVGDAAVLIVGGEAVLLRRDDATSAAEPLAEGSLVGEMAMLIETAHTATVIARTSVRALRLTRTDMHELMAEEPAIAEHLTQKITARLHVLAGELRTIDQALAEIASFDGFSVPVAQSAPASAALH